ncbi:DUF1599 domain-containing protein [Puteibacter caeruleilacunae]|nr:DUF1599 domain-containing protein [Puteibacter caeruleilacunae]
MDEKSIKKYTENVTNILVKKNEDYGGASFDLGLNGNMVHLWDKVSRFRSLVSKGGKDANFESLEDTLKDIIGYAIIGLHILDDETIKDKINGKN